MSWAEDKFDATRSEEPDYGDDWVCHDCAGGGPTPWPPSEGCPRHPCHAVRRATLKNGDPLSGAVVGQAIAGRSQFRPRQQYTTDEANPQMTEQQITVLDIKKLLSVHPADILAVEHRGKLIELDDAARVVPYPQPGVSN